MSKPYSFQIGEFRCFALSDGSVPYPAPLLFANISDEARNEALGESNGGPEQLDVPYTCLLIDTGKQRVLVDTGLGEGVLPGAGSLLKQLRGAGVEPEQVDTVIFTHGHPDHIGGNTDSEGRLVFPNARHVMWKQEWDFWTSETNLSNLSAPEAFKEMIVSFARKHLPPIENQLDLIESSSEILPGIEAVPAPGHTAGHMAMTISSDRERLFLIGDAVIHPLQLEHPEWHTAFETSTEQALDTRRRVLAQAASEQSLILAYHFPFPGLGRVTARGQGWEWSPEIP